jgi:hypothetical protein
MKTKREFPASRIESNSLMCDQIMQPAVVVLMIAAVLPLCA